MSITDFPFLIFIVSTIVLFHIHSSATWRRLVLLSASFAFIFSFARLGSLWPTILFYGSSVLSTLVACRWKWLAFPFAIVLAGQFLVFKGYLGLFLPSGLVTVGMSYILFRSLQILFDLSDGALESSSIGFVDVLLFQSLFLTFSSGPIQQYQAYRKSLSDLDKVDFSQMDLRHIFARIAKGYVKAIALAPVVIDFHTKLMHSSVPTGVKMGSGALIFLCWIYLNFSGYVDIVLGFGRFFGFSIPENFDRPDRSSSFLDFWNRWHITLSRFFLTYVFNPILRWLLRIKLAGPITCGAIGYLIVFFIIGCWHGVGSNFVLSGFLLGIAAVVNKLGQAIMSYMKPASYKKRDLSFVTGGFGIGGCAIAILPDWPIFSSAAEVVDAFGSLGAFIEALLVATLGATLIILLGRAIDKLPHKWVERYDRFAGSPITVGVIMGLLIGIGILFHSETPISFYYQRF